MFGTQYLKIFILSASEHSLTNKIKTNKDFCLKPKTMYSINTHNLCFKVSLSQVYMTTAFMILKGQQALRLAYQNNCSRYVGIFV